MEVTIRLATMQDIPQIDRLLNEVNLVHHNIRPDLFNAGRKYTDEQLREIIQDEQRPIFVAEGGAEHKQPTSVRAQEAAEYKHSGPGSLQDGAEHFAENFNGRLADSATPKEPASQKCPSMNSSCFLGYCMAQFQQIKGDNIRTDVRTLYIDDLCVDENSRGQHVGQQLYQYALQYAKAHGCYNITLHVWEGNDNAAKFYKAMGLRPQYTCLEQIL